MQFKKCDTHVHTGYSLDIEEYTYFKFYFKPIGTPEEVYDAAKKEGMDFVTFTDHDTISSCLELIKKRGPLDDFFISEEVTINLPDPDIRLEINVFDIDKSQHKEIQSLRDDFQNLIEYLKKEKIIYSYNHPFWHPFGDYMINKKKVCEIAKNFNLIEVKNRGNLRHQNYSAERLAARLGLGRLGGTDTHTCSPGKTYTIAKCNNMAGFLKQLGKKKCAPEGEQISIKQIYAEANKVAKYSLKHRFYGVFGLPVINIPANIFVHIILNLALGRYIKNQQSAKT